MQVPESPSPQSQGADGSSGPMLSFDDLLSESMEQQAAHAAEKEMRKRVAQKRGTAEELAADSALLRKWSLTREWKRAANVLSFNRQLCRCGAYHTTLIGKYELHISNRIAGATNLIAVTGFDCNLPKQVVYHDEKVCICHSCADLTEDWPLEDGDD